MCQVSMDFSRTEPRPQCFTDINCMPKQNGKMLMFYWRGADIKRKTNDSHSDSCANMFNTYHSLRISICIDFYMVLINMLYVYEFYKSKCGCTVNHNLNLLHTLFSWGFTPWPHQLAPPTIIFRILYVKIALEYLLKWNDDTIRCSTTAPCPTVTVDA